MSLSQMQSLPAPRSRKRARTEAQLEKKRARDRDSQRVCRERNKERMSAIESELSTLRSLYEFLSAATQELRHAITTDTLSNVPSALESRPASQSESEPAGVRKFSADGHKATHVGSLPVSMSPDLLAPSSDRSPISDRQSVLSDSGQSTQFSVVHGNPSHTSVVDTAVENTTISMPGTMLYELQHGIGLYRSSAPSAGSSDEEASSTPNTGEACQNTLVVPNKSAHFRNSVYVQPRSHGDVTDSFERKVFGLLFNAHRAINADIQAAQQYPRSPSVANLLLIDTDSNPIVQAIGQTLKQSGPLFLADAFAVYFVMYRLLRWRVFPVSETYLDIPPWYRPSPLQRSRPHPICVDLIAFPALRECLITEIDRVDVAALNRDISECMTVQWPADRQLLVKDVRSNEPILHPNFEEHIWDLSNWKMRRAWSWRQPRFAGLVDLLEDEE